MVVGHAGIFPHVIPRGVAIRLTQGFSDDHEGEDYALMKGTPLLVGEGTVIKSWWDKKNGWAVRWQDPEQRYTIGIGHLRAKGLAVGTRTYPGTVIGHSGDSGNATAPSAHVTLWRGTPSEGDKVPFSSYYQNRVSPFEGRSPAPRRRARASGGGLGVLLLLLVLFLIFS